MRDQPCGRPCASRSNEKAHAVCARPRHMNMIGRANLFTVTVPIFIPARQFSSRSAGVSNENKISHRWRNRALHRERMSRKMVAVDAVAEKLDEKLGTWKPEISRKVRAVVSDVIEAADADGLDVLRSRAVEQEVLEQLDEPTSR